MPDPDPNLLLLVIADAAVRRQRAALAAGDAWAWEDLDEQVGALERLIEAEERAARLRGANEWADLPELRERLAEVTRRAHAAKAVARACN